MNGEGISSHFILFFLSWKSYLASQTTNPPKKLLLLRFGKPFTAIASEQYHRPSPSLIIDHLRRKVNHLSSEEVFGKFGSLNKQLAREGLVDDDDDGDDDVGEEKGEVVEVEQKDVGKKEEVDNVGTNGEIEEGMNEHDTHAMKKDKNRIKQQARVKLACDLVGQYLPSQVLEALLSSYE